MSEEKETIILVQRQILELDQIILDRDKDAAFKLLQGEQERSKCIPLPTESKFIENKKIIQELAEALGV